MKCWLGLHSFAPIFCIEHRDPFGMVIVEKMRCERCGLIGWETVQVLGA